MVQEELECKDEYKEKQDDAQGEELLEMVSLTEVAKSNAVLIEC